MWTDISLKDDVNSSSSLISFFPAHFFLAGSFSFPSDETASSWFLGKTDKTSLPRSNLPANALRKNPKNALSSRTTHRWSKHTHTCILAQNQRLSLNNLFWELKRRLYCRFGGQQISRFEVNSVKRYSESWSSQSICSELIIIRCVKLILDW